jgi:hypothetical protein
MAMILVESRVDDLLLDALSLSTPDSAFRVQLLCRLCYFSEVVGVTYTVYLQHLVGLWRHVPPTLSALLCCSNKVIQDPTKVLWRKTDIIECL